MASPLASFSKEDAALLVGCFARSGRLKHCPELPAFVTRYIPSLVAFAITFNIVSLIWKHHRRARAVLAAAVARERVLSSAAPCSLQA